MDILDVQANIDDGVCGLSVYRLCVMSLQSRSSFVFVATTQRNDNVVATKVVQKALSSSSLPLPFPLPASKRDNEMGQSRCCCWNWSFRLLIEALRRTDDAVVAHVAANMLARSRCCGWQLTE